MAALKSRRAILAGEIEALQRQIDWRKLQLANLDGTVTLLGGEPDSIKPVKAYKRVALFKQGELSQTVRDVLRRRGKPMTTYEVILGVTSALGHDDRALPAMDSRVRASLNYLCNIKKTVAKDYRGRLTIWALEN
jgi:hypothetical protein